MVRRLLGLSSLEALFRCRGNCGGVAQTKEERSEAQWRPSETLSVLSCEAGARLDRLVDEVLAALPDLPDVVSHVRAAATEVLGDLTPGLALQKSLQDGLLGVRQHGQHLGNHRAIHGVVRHVPCVVDALVVGLIGMPPAP